MVDRGNAKSRLWGDSIRVSVNCFFIYIYIYNMMLSRRCGGETATTLMVVVRVDEDGASRFDALFLRLGRRNDFFVPINLR